MSGLSAEDREELWAGVRRARYEDAPIPLARDANKTHVLWAVTPAVEQIVARHVAAFKAEAVAAIEAQRDAELAHVGPTQSLGAVQSHMARALGHAAAANIVAHLDP